MDHFQIFCQLSDLEISPNLVTRFTLLQTSNPEQNKNKNRKIVLLVCVTVYFKAIVCFFFVSRRPRALILASGEENKHTFLIDHVPFFDLIMAYHGEWMGLGSRPKWRGLFADDSIGWPVRVNRV